MSYFISVVDGDEFLELPVENDGTLLLSTLQSQFGGSTGLRYMSPEGYSVRGVRLSEGRLYAPEDGWENHVFTVTYARGSREVLDSLRDVVNNTAELFNKVDDTLVKQRASMTEIDKTINQLQDKIFKYEQEENSEKEMCQNKDGDTSKNGSTKKEEQKSKEEEQKSKEEEQKSKEEEQKSKEEEQKSKEEEQKSKEEEQKSKEEEQKSKEDKTDEEKRDDEASQNKSASEKDKNDRKRKYEPPSAFDLYQIDYCIAHADDGKTAEELRDDSRTSWDNAHTDVRRIYETKALECAKRHKNN